ncbi:radical SAM protein [Streptomyces erythrochromogenes]|uniref:radical SAM protein n=1 Tax=Streptomyces erythrochromogenes TaxID=285574 RepID=UPI003867F721|nr:radical SAM protein [Streptomyces erythrochromogenes]WSR88290.1 radical SAM protein [Streptomyces erythrochromogenes]
MAERTYVELLPPHPLRAGYDRTLMAGSIGDAFQRRLEPDRFNPAYFRDLSERIEEVLEAHPEDDTLRWQLAFLLLQNQATAASVERAAGLLASNAHPSAPRLRHLLAGIRARADAPRTERRVTRVNWSINNRCPMACQGCYNPFVTEQISLTQALNITDKLAAHGVTDLIIAGGDPLLWPHTFDVIDHATTNGINVALDTTGYTLTREVLGRLRPLSSLRLPLDGVTAAVQREFRRSQDRNLIAALKQSLTLCDQTGFDKVRVHTVASAANLHELPAIAEEVMSHPSVAQWVIFQWWGRRASPDIIRRLSVPTATVRAAVTPLQSAYPDREVILAQSSDRELLNWMIQSSGQVVTFASEPEEEFILGNLTTDPVEDVLAHPILDFEAMARGVPVTPRAAPSSWAQRN